MTTTAAPAAPLRLPAGATPVRAGGLLSHVRRLCHQHGCECACVGRHRAEGGLVFWCPAGGHHLTAR